MSRTVMCSGFIALDVIQAPGGTWLRAGGTAANVSANLAYMRWGSSIVGLIGRDDAGLLVARDLDRCRVDVSRLILKPDVGTPIVVHEIAGSGHRFKFGCQECGRSYYRHRPISRAELVSMTRPLDYADVFFFDRPTASALALAMEHRAANKLVVYEPASQSSPRRHAAAAAIADVVKFSADRASIFGPSLPASRPGQLWIATQGQEGSQFRFGQHNWAHIDALEVSAIDAGGAGDWMTAALIDQLGPVESWSISEVERVIRHAHAVSALSCLVPGARSISEILTREELLDHVGELTRGKVVTLSFRPASVQTPDICEACRLPLKTA